MLFSKRSKETCNEEWALGTKLRLGAVDDGYRDDVYQLCHSFEAGATWRYTHHCTFALAPDSGLETFIIQHAHRSEATASLQEATTVMYRTAMEDDMQKL